MIIRSMYEIYKEHIERKKEYIKENLAKIQNLKKEYLIKYWPHVSHRNDTNMQFHLKKKKISINLKSHEKYDF